MTKEGTCAFILVEQHVEIALPLTQHALVLERGRSPTAAPRQNSSPTTPRSTG